MRFFCFSCCVALASFLVALPVQAQKDSQRAERRRTQDLVENLDKLITKAERERTADRQLLQELRDLVRQFDWPWQEELLYDNFSDGEFLKNPTWTVVSGDFFVDKRKALTTQYAPPVKPDAEPSGSKVEDIGTAIFGILRDELKKRASAPEETKTAAPPGHAEIYTQLGISNAFVIKLTMISQGGEMQMEFGPYQGSDRNVGYRLVYRPGQKSAFELLRVSPGRAGVIELAELNSSLDDRKEHSIEWRRGMDGTMTVLVDGKELMQTRDRSIKEPFDGFLLMNRGGTYSFPLVEISGTPKG
jgi:hypothetical protein